MTKVLTAGFVLCCLAGVVAPPGRAAPLFDPADPAVASQVTTNDAKLNVLHERERSGLRIDYGHASDWPHAKFAASAIGYIRDWCDYTFLAVTVANPTDQEVKFGIRIDSTASKTRGRQASTAVPSGETMRFLMPLGGNAIIGMRGQPPPPGLTTEDVVLDPGVHDLELKQITAFQLFMPKPEADHSLILLAVELLGENDEDRTAFVDRFGQHAHADWPGKIKNESDLARQRADEGRWLATHPALGDRNRFGGWAAGPRLPATGRFRVEKRNGMWWFVDPEGRLFWSSGITGVGGHGGTTRVAGREFCYQWLPTGERRWAPFFKGGTKNRTFDFYGANLLRKYGEDYQRVHWEISGRRLPAWGVNTIANWSETGTWDLKRVPYTIPMSASGAPRFLADSRIMAGLEKRKYFPDPFHDDYASKLEAVVRKHAARRGDPWLLGVFVDNELAWTVSAPWRTGGPLRISGAALMVNGPDAPVKRALVGALRERYGDVAALNAAWGTTLKDWAEALEPLALNAKRAESAREDLERLDTLIAEEYFRKTKTVLQAWDSDALYFGPRFSGRYTPEVVEVASRYCDAICFNIYEYEPDARTADELADEYDVPVVIGEFHFGSLDRGMFHTGLKKATDQADRAEKYAHYIEAAATAPWCVGAHWFQYKDQALTGRGDGENYNIGFVNVADAPYPELIGAARDVHKRLYPLRAGQ